MFPRYCKSVVFSRNNVLETGNLSPIIKKYQNDFSIIPIEKYMKGLGKKSLNFSKATNDIVLRNIEKLNTKLASQLNDVPKLLKSSLYIKRANLQKKLTTGPLLYFPIYLEFMKDLCMII